MFSENLQTPKAKPELCKEILQTLNQSYGTDYLRRYNINSLKCFSQQLLKRNITLHILLWIIGPIQLFTDGGLIFMNITYIYTTGATIDRVYKRHCVFYNLQQLHIKAMI